MSHDNAFVYGDNFTAPCHVIDGMETMQKFAAEMKQFAKDNPFEKAKAIASLGEAEQHGPMVRATGIVFQQIQQICNF